MTPPTNPSTRERVEAITEAHERVAILRECMAQPREKGSTVLGWKRYVDGLDREASRVESLLALLEDGERVEGHTVPMWLMDEVQRAIDEMGPASEWRGLLCALKYVSGRQLSQAEKDHALTLHPTEEGHK